MRLTMFFAAFCVATAACAEVAEPPGLWSGPMQGETPKTLAGAQIVDAAQIKALQQAGALLIDASAEPPARAQPSELAEPSAGAEPSKFWAPIHRSIPGAVWLPGAGRGDADAAFAQKFAAHVAQLYGANPERAIAVFCHPSCWGSWNAGKRLIQAGYRHVYWFPGGIEAYQEKFGVEPIAADRTLAPPR